MSNGKELVREEMTRTSTHFPEVTLDTLLYRACELARTWQVGSSMVADVLKEELERRGFVVSQKPVN